MSKGNNKTITEFLAKKVPRQELIPLIVRTNIEKFSPDNELFCLSHQLEYKHGQRDSQIILFDYMLVKVKSFEI